MSRHERLVNYSFQAMGSPCHIQFYAAATLNIATLKAKLQQYLYALEQRYSRYIDSSVLSRINRAAGSGKKTMIDAEMVALLSYAEQCYQESDGLFDVTSGVLRRIWFTADNTVPHKAQIDALLPLIGWEHVQWDKQSLYLPLAGMELDFGGIVKEYAADSVANLLVNLGVYSGLVELGGDIKVIGPQPDNQGWPVAIRDPRKPDKHIMQLSLRSGSLASSGDYERYQDIEGIRYSHILNPKTGWPVTGLRAVSILSEHCVVAGSLATLAMLKGKQGLAWLNEHELNFFCCENDGTIHKHCY